MGGMGFGETPAGFGLSSSGACGSSCARSTRALDKQAQETIKKNKNDLETVKFIFLS